MESFHKKDIKDKIINILTNKYIKNIAITFHVSPDGDAIGSAVAFALALQSLGKQVDIISSSHSSIFLPLLKDVTILKKAKKVYDICLLLDCSDYERTVTNIDNIAKSLIIIDHHETDRIVNNLYWYENVASTTFMIFDLLKLMKINITDEIATALYLGIFSDTSGFTNTNVNSSVLYQAAELIDLGADLQLVNQICRIKTLSMLKLMGQMFSQIIFDNEYKIAYLVLLREDLKKFNLTYDIVEFLINELKNIKEADIVYLFIESNNDTKIKGRSKGNIRINKIMEYFGGSGHKNSSGCKVNSLNIYNIVDSVITRTRLYIDEHPEELPIVHTNENLEDDNYLY